MKNYIRLILAPSNGTVCLSPEMLNIQYPQDMKFFRGKDKCLCGGKADQNSHTFPTRYLISPRQKLSISVASC